MKEPGESYRAIWKHMGISHLNTRLAYLHKIESGIENYPKGRDEFVEASLDEEMTYIKKLILSREMGL